MYNSIYRLSRFATACDGDEESFRSLIIFSASSMISIELGYCIRNGKNSGAEISFAISGGI